MIEINRKTAFEVNEENLQMDSFYASKDSVYYLYDCYIDNKCIATNKRYCLVRVGGITERSNGEYKGSFAQMFEEKSQLVRALRQFSCMPTEFQLNEV
jgi:hypothetical protein